MAHLPTGLLLFTSSLESVGGKESSRRAHLISHFSVWKQQFYGFLMQLGFPGGLVVKNPPASAGDTGLITGSGRSPKMAIQSSILAREIPLTEDPGRLPSMESQESQIQLSN